jgi:hypothetical protein
VDLLLDLYRHYRHLGFGARSLLWPQRQVGVDICMLAESLFSRRILGLLAFLLALITLFECTVEHIERSSTVA